MTGSRILDSSLKEIIRSRPVGSQSHLIKELENRGIDVTQSTVSRALTRIGAVRGKSMDGKTTYQLIEESAPQMTGLSGFVLDMKSNGSLIVLHTLAGSANLVARQIDLSRQEEILGTIAGDDTVLVIPKSTTDIDQTFQALETII